MLEPINSFTGEYAFLSNFYPSFIVHEGILYPTVEHAYQASKTYILEEKLQIQGLEKPGQAKRVGRNVTLRDDWEKVKVPIMFSLLKQKFTEHPELQFKLLETHPRPLIEGNNWGDTFWGVCNGVGKNVLGDLLETVRFDLTCRVAKN